MSLFLETKQIGRASQDPALAFLLLFPLALVHLAGSTSSSEVAAFSLPLQFLASLGPSVFYALATLLVIGLLWAIGRIQQTEIPWRGGAALLILEGVFWGGLLGPVLRFLTRIIPMDVSPLAIPSLASSFSFAAGAGLYEELLFRGVLFSVTFVILRSLWELFFSRSSAAVVVAYGLSLIFSSSVFAWAHVLGDPQALDAPVFIFRFLASALFCGLYTWRGLAVVAWAHATYDALLLFPS